VQPSILRFNARIQKGKKYSVVTENCFSQTPVKKQYSSGRDKELCFSQDNNPSLLFEAAKETLQSLTGMLHSFQSIEYLS
jgi:hypothetical protein